MTERASINHVRSFGVPCSQYIDDRHQGEIITPPSCQRSHQQKAEVACYITTPILTSLGYTISLSKSCLIPKQVVRYLGYLSDSQRCAFVLPDDKKQNFRDLREVYNNSNYLFNSNYYLFISN